MFLASTGGQQPMARIPVTEEIADNGLQKLRDAGHDVEVRLGLSPQDPLGAVAGANALIIRSATTASGPAWSWPTRPWASSVWAASAPWSPNGPTPSA
jgi:hypothetical protein